MFIRRMITFVLCFLMVGLFAGGVLAAGDKLVGETWSLVEQDSKPIGYGCDKTWQNKEGYRYVSEMTLKIDFMGKITPVNVYVELIVDRKYYAKSYTFINDTNGSRTEIKGVLKDGKVMVTLITADGREHQQEYDLTEPVYFETSLLAYVVGKKGLKTGARHTGKTWDPVNNETENYVMTVGPKTTYVYRGKKIPVFTVKSEKEQGPVYTMDTKGNLYYGEFPAQNLTTKMIVKEEIPELQAMSADVLLVPGNIRVARPYRSTTSQIKVSINGTKPMDFCWDDNRQKLISTQKTATGREMVVEIKRDERDFTGKVQLPVIGSEFSSYLGDTNYITPSLPEIRTLAETILAKETDGWLATQKIVQWVSHNMKGELTPGTLTTKEILAQKKGKCVEYAVLFAAIARAAGLPTRVAFGERYDGSAWIGHLWNEVWLGEWVAVDSSHAQAAPDALLLKFQHSDSVNGVQKLRLALTGNLNIFIEDVQISEDEDTSLDGMTGIVGQTYINPDFGCQVTGPEGWMLAEGTDQGYPFVSMLEPTGGAQVVFLIIGLPGPVKPEDVMTARLGSMQTMLPEFKLRNQQSLEVNGLPATMAEWTFTQNEMVLVQQNWVLVNNDTLYLFVFSALEDNWETFQEVFQQIRESFKK